MEPEGKAAHAPARYLAWTRGDSAGTTPDELLLAAQAGDPTALERLLRKNRQGVYRYGLQVCRTTEDAEDAVQETLWAATRAIQTFRGAASSVVSWMFTIVRRECFRLLERHRTEPLLVYDDATVVAERQAMETSGDQERAELLASALRQLHPLHREVILLRDIEGFSAPEAAARLGISVAALKSRLHRARENLRGEVLAARIQSASDVAR
jgi:RNA polymerase sigma-70 factor (ECF subfamily)